MIELRFVHLTTGKAVSVTKEQVFAVIPADSLGGTYILGPGGAIVPVTAKPDEVRQVVYERRIQAAPTDSPTKGNNKPTRRGT